MLTSAARICRAYKKICVSTAPRRAHVDQHRHPPRREAAIRGTHGLRHTDGRVKYFIRGREAGRGTMRMQATRGAAIVAVLSVAHLGLLGPAVADEAAKLLVDNHQQQQQQQQLPSSRYLSVGNPRPRALEENAAEEGASLDIGGGANIAVRNGVLIQSGGCPQAISEEEAAERAADSSLPGSVMTLLSQNGGRTGNHFLNLSTYFSMAYCCRSKVLTMPQSDVEMPTEEEHLGGWEATRRWFDFSRREGSEGITAMMDLLPDFRDLYERPEVCQPKWAQKGNPAFHLVDVHPDLQRCVDHVFVRGCEAEYLGELVKTSDFCPVKKSQGDRRRTRRRLALGDGDKQPEGEGGEGAGRAGSLVIHIRSGDIFNVRGQGGRRPTFGQFFLEAIASKPWSDVTVVTFAKNHRWVNPAFSALEVLNRSGVLGPNVSLYKNRPLLDDLRTMLCADGLAVSRSSLHFFTFAHSRAKTLIMPNACGSGTYSTVSRAHHTEEAVLTNTTLVAIEKPDAEVYGIEWVQGAEAYSPYAMWNDTKAQLLEMVLFKGVQGLKRCTVDD